MRQLQNESLQEINNQVPFTLPKQGFEKTLVFFIPGKSGSPVSGTLFLIL